MPLVYYLVTYIQPNAGERKLRFKCFGRSKQKFEELRDQGLNPTWEKIEGEIKHGRFSDSVGNDRAVRIGGIVRE